MEAKKQSAGEEDLSMEEILQSIRRIIADDAAGDKPKDTTPPAATEAADVSAVAKSDILELTDMIEDDGTITNLKDANKDEKSVDVLDNIDAAIPPKESPQKNTVKEEAPAPKTEEVVVAATAPTISTIEVKKEEKVADENIDKLLSKAAEEAAVSSLSKLNIPDEKPMQTTTPSPEFRSGSTVEDLVEELLKPMMKDWLDNNLPAIVERIVEREVLRLTRR